MANKPFKAFVMVEIEGEAYNEHSTSGVVHRIKTAIEVGAKKYAGTAWQFKCSHLPEIKFIEPEETSTGSDDG